MTRAVLYEELAVGGGTRSPLPEEWRDATLTPSFAREGVAAQSAGSPRRAVTIAPDDLVGEP